MDSKMSVVGPEAGRRTGLVGGLALLQRSVGDAHREGLEPGVAVAAHLDLEPLGEGVDHRDTDAVETTGDLVAAAAELATGVEHRQHDRDRRELLTRGDVDRDAPAVVGDLDTAIGHQRDLGQVAVAGQRLVHGVVDDLLHQVVQAALARGADVHAGALAHRLEALEDLDRAGVVVARLDAVPLGQARRHDVWGGRVVVGDLRVGLGRLDLVGHAEVLFCWCRARVAAALPRHHNGRHTRGSATSAQSTRHTRTITPPVHRLWGSRPKNAPQRRGTGPMRPVQGGGRLPIPAMGPATAPVGVSAVGVPGAAALDAEPAASP